MTTFIAVHWSTTEIWNYTPNGDLQVRQIAHLMAYMNKYNIIHESQSGFRRKHSFQTALVKLIDQWMAGNDKGDTNGSMFIDFRKAFDLVDRKILIQKLAAYRFNRSSLL